MAPWERCLLHQCEDPSSLPRTHLNVNAIRRVYILSALLQQDRTWRQENPSAVPGIASLVYTAANRRPQLKNQSERQGSRHPRLSSDLHMQCTSPHLHNHNGRREHCPSLDSVCYDEHNQKQPVEEGGYFILQVKTHHQRKPRQGT